MLFQIRFASELEVSHNYVLWWYKHILPPFPVALLFKVCCYILSTLHNWRIIVAIWINSFDATLSFVFQWPCWKVKTILTLTQLYCDLIRLFGFICSGRACHRIRCRPADGSIRSGIRRLHAEQGLSSGGSHQHVWRPDGARLQKTKTGVERPFTPWSNCSSDTKHTQARRTDATSLK